MSAERKESIDEQLKAFARQRRESLEKPVELSSFNRKLLLDEVGRVSVATNETSLPRPSWLHALWPRMAFACGVLFLSITAALYWLPKRGAVVSDAEKGSLVNVAQRAPAGPADKSAPAHVAEPSIAQAAEELDRNATLAQVPETRRFGLLRSESSDAPVPAQPKNENEELKAKTAESVASPQLSYARNGIPGVAPAAPSAASKPLAKADSDNRLGVAGGAGAPLEVASKGAEQQPTPPPAEAQLGRRSRELAESSSAGAAALALKKASTLESVGRLSESVDNTAKSQMLSFFQTATRNNYRQNFNSPPMPPVLQKFKVEQAGPSVRVIDADGSVYLGNLETRATATVNAPALALADEKRKENLARSLQNSVTQNAAQSEFSNFRVSGTNRSLNQMVVFSANITRLDADTAKDASRQSGNKPAAAPNYQLDGKATLGPRTELSIQATGKPE